MPSTEYTLTVIEQLGLRKKVSSKEVLFSLAEIAAYLGVSISTTRRLIKHAGLPAARNSQSAPYITTKEIIRQWIVNRHLQLVIDHEWDKHLPHKGTSNWPKLTTYK